MKAKNEFGGDVRKAPALAFGGALHKGWDAMYVQESLAAGIAAFESNYQDYDGERTRTTARGISILEDYWDRYMPEIIHYESVLAEYPFQVELGKIHTSSGEWSVFYGGIVDKILLTDTGKWLCIDHKTTTNASQAHQMSFELSNQFYGYLWGALTATNVPRLDEVVVDLVIVNPKNTDFFQYPIKYSETKLAAWEESILMQARMIMMLYEEPGLDRWPGYGQDACCNYRQLCEMFSICTSNSKQESAVKKLFFKESRWKVLRDDVEEGDA